MTTSQEIIKEIQSLASPTQAQIYKRFFKTGKGEYGQGDYFVGVKVPLLRKIAKAHTQLALTEVKKLLTNNIHEIRFCALIILIQKYELATKQENHDDQKKIVLFYLKHTKYVNNWDLVDVSAVRIIGHYTYHNMSFVKKLSALSKSTNMWEQRISIVATHYFIKHKDFSLTLAFAKQNIKHKHDLMHKATGWMLREVGKQNKQVLDEFLHRYATKMPRVMLRYAIEKHSIEERKKYLTKK